MCDLERFLIDFKALTEDETSLEYDLDNHFFDALEGAQVQEGSLHVSGSIRKAVGFFELQLHTTGTIRIPCDRCLDLMDQPIEADLRLVIKLGDTYTEEDDIITVEEHDPVLNIAWFIYESIILAVPIQHVHQPGDCNDAMMRVLEQHSAARSSDADAQEIDPRWSALLKLKEKS
ncbi:DUF177 domain-containing protein [Prevotella sp. E13-17]|uniref:YceD family protein n=1 Tax=Prevotella sp. E13-17 TaxID=2913616 RepID=UPI001EDA8412|nr:DUF177 domain-containing protein [Prevotella sp. E13-17]UKK50561.1 DUF177 domain-containing protein [Prevotella sp. E13-17]